MQRIKTIKTSLPIVIIKTDVSDKTDTDSGTVTITASSVEELLQKIQDYMQLAKSDTVLTEAEKKVGQNIDFCG